MTTPEKLRRRQRLEIALLILMLTGTGLYGWFDSNRDEARRDCLVTTVEQLRDYQAVRDMLVSEASKLRETEDKHEKLGDRIQSDLIRDVFEAQERTEITAAFVRFDRRDMAWTKMRNRIDRKVEANLRKRERTKVPPFPSGRCDSELGKDDLR